jgi:hypothetical protein
MPEGRSKPICLYTGSRHLGSVISSKGKHQNGKENPVEPRTNGTGLATILVHPDIFFLPIAPFVITIFPAIKAVCPLLFG